MVLVFLRSFQTATVVVVTVPATLTLSALPFIPVRVSLGSSALINVVVTVNGLISSSVVIVSTVSRGLQNKLQPLRTTVRNAKRIFLTDTTTDYIVVTTLIPAVLTKKLAKLVFINLI